MKHSFWIVLGVLSLSSSIFAAEVLNEAAEPELKGDQVIHLIAANTLKGWKVPSDRWTIADGVIAGDTKGEKLKTPEWLYTQQSFSDFIFSAEVKLSNGAKANSGIYFRAKPFSFEWRKSGISYEAPSGYEYDAASAGKHNGSLGDWYARPSLRIYPDPALLKLVFKKEDWNRMTIRARGNRIEYWLNGAKIMDYVDLDPKRSHEGLIGLQMHDKLEMKVELRKAVILPLKKGE